MTAGLRRRLLAGREAEERAQDSESALPLSTSSAFVTVGTAAPNGTWDLRSTLHSSDHVTPDTLVSAEGSAATGDAVTELMRQTLECTGTRSTHIKDLSHTVADEHHHSSDDDDDVDFRNSPRDATADCTGNILFRDGKPDEQNPETRASTDVDRYTDSLKSAQMLLKRLNEMTACSSRPIAVASDHCVDDSPIAADFDADIMQEDDTLANIWALRQSARCDDSDKESLDSTSVMPNEREKSYVSPRALNDVELNHDDFSASSRTADDPGGCGDAGNVAELESERTQQSAIGSNGDSGDTWFIDSQDLRAVDNMAASEIGQRLHADADTEPPNAGETAKVIEDVSLEVHSPGRPLLQSSPSSLAQLSPAGSTARKSRSLRRTAVQRREMCREQYSADGSDSESDIVASLRLRHRHPQISQPAPHDRPSAVDDSVVNDDSRAVVNATTAAVDDQVKDVVVCNQETSTVANQHNVEDEPQSTGSDVVTARSANHSPPARNAGIAVSDDQVLNGYHSASGEDSYPSQQHLDI